MNQVSKKNFRKYFQIHIVEFKNLLEGEVSAIIFSIIFADLKAICLGGLNSPKTRKLKKTPKSRKTPRVMSSFYGLHLLQLKFLKFISEEHRFLVALFRRHCILLKIKTHKKMV